MGDIMERVVPGALGYGVGLLVQHLSRYVRALDYTGIWALPVLDASCGAGYGLSILSQRASTVVGIDKSEEALNECRKLYYYCDCTLNKVDLEKGKIPVPFLFYGAVTSFETIEHLENPEHFLRNVYNVLWDDGYFVFSIPRTGITAYHKQEFTCFGEVEKLISKFFNVELWLGQKHIVGDCPIREADFWFGAAKKKVVDFPTVDKFICTRI